MRTLFLAILIPGCAATFHRYHEVEFLDGSYQSGQWTCSKRGAMHEPKLYCYDASKAVLVLPGPAKVTSL
jgi:hypothetical protein